MKPSPTVEPQRNPYASSQAANWTWFIDFGHRLPRTLILASHFLLAPVYGILATLGVFLIWEFSQSVHFVFSGYPRPTSADVWNAFKMFTSIGTVLSTMGSVFALVLNGRGALKPHVGALFLLFLGTFGYVLFSVLSPAQQQDVVFGFGARGTLFLSIGLLFWVPWIFTCVVYWVVVGWIANRERVPVAFVE